MRRIFILIALYTFSALHAAPQRRMEGDDLKAFMGTIRNEISNQHYEIKVMQERVETLDATLESIQKDVSTIKILHKDRVAQASQDAEFKIGSLDLAAKSTAGDIKALKNVSNETATTLAQFKLKIAQLEKIVDAQNKNIDSLQAALQALTEVLQDKDAVKATKTYVVKSGDALEKIARAHKMTLDEIKELNGLTHTKIKIGQKLLVIDR